MQDILGKQIERGDIMLKIYNNGNMVFAHVATGLFTRQYVKSIRGDFEQERIMKIMPKSLIVVSEEEFSSYIEKQEREIENSYEEEEDKQYFLEENTKIKNTILEISRKFKAER